VFEGFEGFEEFEGFEGFEEFEGFEGFEGFNACGVQCCAFKGSCFGPRSDGLMPLGVQCCAFKGSMPAALNEARLKRAMFRIQCFGFCKASHAVSFKPLRHGEYKAPLRNLAQYSLLFEF
jgi:hypothetical protein